MRCTESGRASAQEAEPEPQRLDLGNTAVPHGSPTPPSIPIIPTDTHRGCRHMCKKEASRVRNISYADISHISTHTHTDTQDGNDDETEIKTEGEQTKRSSE